MSPKTPDSTTQSTGSEIPAGRDVRGAAVGEGVAGLEAPGQAAVGEDDAEPIGGDGVGEGIVAVDVVADGRHTRQNSATRLVNL